MHLLFLCGFFDEKLEKEIFENSKEMVQYAANNLQKNLIEGFLTIEDIELEILSAPLISSYPKGYRKMLFKGYKTRYLNKANLTYVGFFNLLYIRNISRKISLIKNIKKFACSGSGKKVIFVYSAHTPFLQAARFAKRIDPSIHVCLMVPDLPQFMNLSYKKSLVYRILKKTDIYIFRKHLKSVDSFVLLTKFMKDALEIVKRNYIVVEGVVNTTSYVSDLDKQNNCRSQPNPLTHLLPHGALTVVYTGTLNRKFGIINLIEAFTKIKIPNVYLILCGSGDAEDVVKEYSKNDRRIIYLGILPNNVVREIQKSATLLVNPRQNNEEFTKYSFPSKNMEYLVSGRPVVAYKLDGIPDEYDKYLLYPKDNTVESLAEKIQEVLLMEEGKRAKIGRNAKEFVIREKNNVAIARKIYNMIKKCISENR